VQKIVISQHPRRAQPLKIDDEMYKWWHLVENFFCIAPCLALSENAFKPSRAKPNVNLS